MFDDISVCLEIFTVSVNIDPASLENSVNIRYKTVSWGMDAHLHPLHAGQDVEDLLVVVDVIDIIFCWQRDILTCQSEHIVLTADCSTPAPRFRTLYNAIKTQLTSCKAQYEGHFSTRFFLCP